MNSIEKQPDETFIIESDFVNVLTESETIQLSESTVNAVDVNGDDATSEVLDLGTKMVEDSKLKIRIKEGNSDYSPYKITFKAVTDENNIYELDIILEVKEI